LEWLRQVAPAGGYGLIVAPLAVAEQTIAEAATMGMEVSYAVGGEALAPGLWITNYERLHRFDPASFGAVVLDESSILKSTDGKTRTKLLKEWTEIPFRLCCTATPAPNDISELANHAEFLGVLSRVEMLAAFFTHTEGADWRLKGHAREPFFRWMASWAAYIRRPSDLGFADDGFALPPLNVRDEVVSVDWQPSDGTLFPQLEGGVQGRHTARRGSLDARVRRSAEIIRESPGQWLVWCGLNEEGRRLAKALGADAVLIEGADSPEVKIERERRWRSGQVRVLISKPSIFGFGLNWQHCHQMVFLGLGDSWEQYYQAIRRCWRFGQKSPVEAVVVISEAEGRIAENIRGKEEESLSTAQAVIDQMAEFERAEVVGATIQTSDYQTGDASGVGWRLLLGDSCERLREMAAHSAGLSVHSPPFASLYTYSASDRDLGNSRDYDQFFAHYRFIIRELARITMPGRRACVHVQQVSTTKATHGVIGWRDFRADVVRTYQEEGWVYDGEVVIDKDPQVQAIRTKSKALMFVQKNKDSAWSRPAMADYILLFRAPGDNAVPVLTDVTNDEWIRWARPVWYGIRETATLQASAARTDKDEKHIAPLQLETVERCVRLWSNKGELVVDPFTGIGTTGYVALQKGRRFAGVELKPEYFAQAVLNLRSANDQMDLPLENSA
jgi:DNA modification methylase